ncbi:hypothetical protein [Micromonospora radicis]|uniref:hypothetical protein n=1 Tax=Micromonospora radicis TaxID=1894971 RepID=UPI00131477B3|nr:hypothetical protein [Micromonospora radicis]
MPEDAAPAVSSVHVRSEAAVDEHVHAHLDTYPAAAPPAGDGNRPPAPSPPPPPARP